MFWRPCRWSKWPPLRVWREYSLVRSGWTRTPWDQHTRADCERIQRQMTTQPPSRRQVSSSAPATLILLHLLAGAAGAAPPLVGVSPQGDGRAAYLGVRSFISFPYSTWPNSLCRRGVLRAGGHRLQGRLGILPEAPPQRRVLRLLRWNRRARSPTASISVSDSARP